MYSTDGSRIFWRHYPVVGADPASFEALNDTWSRDATRVYRQHKRLDADRATFVALSRIVAKDKDHVFELEGVVKAADPATFEVLRPLQEAEDESLCREYFRDREHVFHKVMTIGKVSLVKNADPRTFRALGHGFGSDSDAVFHELYRLPQCDPSSWRRLGLDYSRDDKRVYLFNRKIEHADPVTFQPLPGALTGAWARDANRFYKAGTAADPAAYWDELRTFTIFSGTIVAAEVVDRNYKALQRPEPSVEDGCRFTVTCAEVLHDGGSPVSNRPETGGQFQFLHFDNLVRIVPADWLGRTRIWFCVPRAQPGEGATAHLSPRDWRTFWPASRRADVEQLLASLKPF
jgi:hypothetical protein